ncbi:substrate-binding periplasmic protein [Magnetospirillum moscoviense]|uniref:Amino acid ABC transporter n=1 Tax=Magnetospirillum moscoviense TaxID=1437059 RepID=A0A178MPT9_9PROT|nr:amino acid ABC transporter [Magnetospirillum moscoviense]OAN50095.1 amino acid ABC transporter [Magnetospirillum moscoviense]
MMLRVLATAFTLSCLAAAPALAAELEYVYPDQSVWTTRVDAKGEPDNPLLRLANVMFTQAGIKWTARGYPATRMFEVLKSGTAQFSMLVRAPALAECCLYGKNPVASTELRAYRQADTAALTAKEGLAGKRVALIRGYSYAGLKDFIADPANAVRTEEVTSHDAAFALLARDRVDYVLDYAGPAREVLAGHPISRVQSDLVSRLDVYLVLSKTYPDADAVIARLQAIADRLDKERILAGTVR